MDDVPSDRRGGNRGQMRLFWSYSPQHLWQCTVHQYVMKRTDTDVTKKLDSMVDEVDPAIRVVSACVFEGGRTVPRRGGICCIQAAGS